MKLLRRLALLLISLAMPATGYACGGGMDMGDGGTFQTPVSMRGQYIFVTRVSRRHLRQDIFNQQVTTQLFNIRTEA